jgi:hypothetical protein
MHRELFLDEVSIAHMEGLRRTLHQPQRHPANPVVPADRPWENMASVYGTTIYDAAASKFRMWYLIGCPSDGEFTDEQTGARHPLPQTTRVGYAESADGVTWHKPDLGQLEWRGSTANNMLALGRQNPEGISVLVDEGDPDATLRSAYSAEVASATKAGSGTSLRPLRPPKRDFVAREGGSTRPARRYKALFWDHAADGAWVHPELKRVLWKETAGDGAYLAWSADGIHWAQAPESPVISQYMDTNQNLLWDPRLKRYVAFSRFGFGRKIARSESADFAHWEQPRLVLDCDERDGEGTQFYGAGIDLYEGLYVAMLWVYREGGDGCIDTQLGVSRDGVHWERVADRQVFLPLGEPGSWEDGMARAAERIIHVGDRLYIYYSGVNGPHSGPKFPPDTIVRKHKPAIGLATLRRDGFVSLDAAAREGWLLTHPLHLPRGRLHLNLDARGGQCAVGLCEEEGHPIPGFEKSRTIAGDATDVEVTWPHPVAPPVGRSVTLRISLARAALYSYWFE